MGFAERVEVYKHLGNSDIIAKAIFADYGLDLGKEAARLNNKAPELNAGEILMAGAREAVDAIVRSQPRLPTPKGLVRPWVYRNNLTTPEPEPDSDSRTESDLAQELRSGIEQQYERNAEERKRGDFVHILDCTVQEITNLAARYRKTAQTYFVAASSYEWLAQEAINRGLGENDTLRKVFTEQELVEAAIPVNTQTLLNFGADEQPHA